MPQNPTQLYNSTSFKISGVVTKSYSTSFSIAAGMLGKQQRDAIYAVYGFVRLADEIVDTFHQFPKKYLLNKFEHDLFEALTMRISLNPVLHSFQQVVHQYNIPHKYIKSFILSMKADLEKKEYTTEGQMNEYIYGSAEVVGLICLKIFTKGDVVLFDELQNAAMKLGSIFQKVNFLRDLKYDTDTLGRTYFPDISGNKLNDTRKHTIILEIEKDCNEAFKGIVKLPSDNRAAVLTAYYYYHVLLMRIKNTPAEKIYESRIRISNVNKILLLIKAKLACQLNLL